MHCRQQFALDGDWLFWPDETASLTPATLSADTARSIAVPGPWQAQFDDLRDYSGPGWYRRSVDVPAAWAGLRVILGFGAADYLAEVWVNGIEVGQHEGGYLPFELDITDAARPGENVLVVRVTDPPELLAEIPHGKQSWYGPLSGLWQSVWVESRPAQHILNVRLTPDAAAGVVSVDVATSHPLSSTDRVQVSIVLPDGAPVADGQSAGADLALSIADPQLWDVDTPNLYTATITLDSATGHDTVVDTFGFRTVETRQGRIWLNGRPLYLRGALDQDYYPDLICTPPSEAYIENQFRQARAMGLNCLRIHIKIGDPRYYAAADRVGLLIWTELPNWGHLTEASAKRGRETIAGMIDRDWNHPSIIVWNIINEAWGTELSINSDHRAWLADLFERVKELDPTRLVVDNSACFDNAHVKSDLDDFHFYAAMPEGAERWDAWVEELANRPPWLYAPEYQANREHGAPLIVSEFGNWGLPDIGPLLEQYGGEPWWFESAYDWGGGDVYAHGAERRLRDLHLDKVFGDFTGLARAAQEAQFEGLRYEIEAMRLRPQISGYVITEFTDVHWESNGLLDMLRRPKVHFQRLAEINADTMIIPRTTRRSWRSGEAAIVDLNLAHSGAEALHGATLTWALTGDQVTIESGAEKNLSLDSFGVVKLPPLELAMPAVAFPSPVILDLIAADNTGKQIAHTSLPLIIFPPATTPPGTVVCTDEILAAALTRGGCETVAETSLDVPWVTATFDDSHRRFAQEGGKVLFLAETPDALQTSVPRLSLAARQGTPWSGDWASSLSWYRRDLWAGALPGDGLLGFAFSTVLPQTVISSVQSLDFREEVVAGLFVGWLRRPAGLVQKRPLGRGTLLVSTLRLVDALGHDPLADYLLREHLLLL